MKPDPRLSCATLLAVCSTLACTGSIGDGPGGGSSGQPPGGGEVLNPGGTITDPSGGGSSTSGGGGGEAVSMPGPAPLRRLTIREYNNTVRDLLGVDARAASNFGIDRESGGFSTGGPVTTSTDASRLLESAETVANAATAKLAALLPCPGVAATDQAAQATCARTFIEKFGRRAFRRPLSKDEVDDLFKLYSSHRGGEINYSFDDSIKAVLTAILVAPQFIYRTEGLASPPIRDGKVIRFGPHELAARLSYGLWGTMPDDQLFAAADDNRLTTRAQINEQTRRMLADPKAGDAIADFHDQWLELERLPQEATQKDPKFKEFTPELAAAMAAETEAFTRALLSGPKASGSLEQLFTSTATTVTPELAKIYGVTMNGPGAQPVTLDGKQRAGILTQAGFLTMHSGPAESNPVRRGAVVVKRVLCLEVPPPPNDAVGQPAPPAPGLTTRERFAEHAKNACATCHVMMDPLGFAFENYDAIGSFRTTEQGDPIDATGSVKLPSGELTFSNAVDLSAKLVNTPEARDCLSTQWLRYFMRRAELPGDEPSLRVAREAWKKAGYDIRELLVALTETPAFTHRTASIGEVLP